MIFCYADDLAVLAVARNKPELGLNHALKMIKEVAGDMGMEISLPKTIEIKFGKWQTQPEPVYTDEDPIRW